MTKCNLCLEDLDAGKEPACVAACPVRALDFGDFSGLAERYGLHEQPAELPPLPNPRLTEPSLLLAPHADAHRSAEPDVVLTPRPARGLREISLVVFTLLSQMAAGLALVGGGLRVWLGPESAHVDAVLWPLTTTLMALAMFFSTLHLGQPRNARRALVNLSTSWLSREILLALTFFAATILAGLPLSAQWLPVAASWLTIPLAGAYLWGMAGVYRQRTVPVWNRARTPWSFLVTALLLGGVGVNALVWSFAHLEKELVQSISIWLLVLCVVGVGLPWRLWQMREMGGAKGRPVLGLTGALGNAFGLSLLALLVVRPDLVAGNLPLWVSWGLLLLVGADQVVQRRRYFGGYERVGV
jgi:DMSO reductase anchor subunit